MWTYYIDGLGKDNKYLLPGRNGGPLCYKTIHGLMWKTYLKTWSCRHNSRRDGHVVDYKFSIKRSSN